MVSIKSSIGNTQDVSLDDVCYLIATFSSKDDLGQAIIAEKLYMAFCSKLSITRAEFNSAGSAGFKPDMMLVVDSDTYEKEKSLEYQGKKYSIYKTFARKDGFTELYCEDKQGD
jgi:hypothetical protein